MVNWTEPSTRNSELLVQSEAMDLLDVGQYVRCVIKRLAPGTPQFYGIDAWSLEAQSRPRHILFGS
jgi:hypothetical protein